MRVYFFTGLASLILAVSPAPSLAQDDPGGDAVNTTIDATSWDESAFNPGTPSAESSADPVREAATESVDRAREDASDTLDNARESAANSLDEANQTAANASQAASEATDDAAAAESGPGEHRDEQARRADPGTIGDQSIDSQVTAETRQRDRRDARQLDRGVADGQRNADWRFVQRNGVWWYRTPADTWMIRQGNQWTPYRHSVGFRGDQDSQQPQQQGDNAQPMAGHQYDATNQSSTAQVNDQGYAYQTAYEQTNGQADTAQQHGGRQWGSNHHSVGQIEWMCIDGRMRQVRVISVRPVDAQTASGSAASYPDQQASYDQPAEGDAQPQDQEESDRMTPPPVPQPSDTPQTGSQDHPPAPSASRSSGSDRSSSTVDEQRSGS